MPQSNYTGVCVVKTPSGKILSVQVKDIHGNSIPLPPRVYRTRRIKPPLELLPVSVVGNK